MHILKVVKYQPFRGLNERGVINVSFKLKENKLEIKITDNGIVSSPKNSTNYKLVTLTIIGNEKSTIYRRTDPSHTQGA